MAITNAYYDDGKLRSVTDSNGRIIGYDLYDGLGQRKQVTILAGSPDAQVIGYDYDDANRPWHITSSAGTFTYTYDSLGRPDNLTYPNNTLADWDFDDLGRLTAINHKVSGGAAFTTFSYPIYDKVGNRKSVSGNRNESYLYDELYRLLTVTAAASENFLYDPAGNRTLGPGAKDTGFVHNDANQMTAGRKLGYSYDNAGNQTTRTQPGVTDKSWAQTWDYENRLVKVEKVKGSEIRTVTFKYDPFGRRIEKKAITVIDGVTSSDTFTYVYDNEDIVLEVLTHEAGGVTTTETTRFTHGPGIDAPLTLERNGSYYYYHADGLGSIVALTDASHNVVQSYEYDSFGVVKPSTGFRNSYTYTGREWDKETGLYYYRARYYDPMEGRFISKDPIGFAGGDVTLYGYVQNNPVNYIDPTGNFTLANYATFMTLVALTYATEAYLLSPAGQKMLQQAEDLIRQIEQEAKKRLQQSRCETRVPDGNIPGQKHDPNNKTPDPNDPLWKKILWMVGKLIQLYAKWPH